jgi:acyl-CoA reductase-like NAD-dependent aldehyde dehydrogenase
MSAVSPIRTSEQQAADNAPSRLIISTNPGNGQKIGEVRATTPGEVQAIMEAARLAQGPWEQLGLRRRLALMRRLKDALYRNMDLIVDTIVAEQGRPPFEALVEFWPTIEMLAYYLRIAERMLAPQRIFVRLLPYRRHWVERRPYGVVLAITPWNFPLLLSLGPIMAALIAGNSVVYKPSEFATQLGEVIARTIHEAGIPPEVFQIVHGEGDVGAALVRAKPNKICLTGSAATGRKVAGLAGELLIPVVLELGGKDAAIVLEDADLDRTAMGVAWAGMMNAGQACLSIQRVYVMRQIADLFVEKLAQAINRHIRVGPGADEGTTMGAITTGAQLKIITSQVQEAVDQGARLVVGGHTVEDSAGRFYLPTVITNVTPDMRIAKDETFGPVIIVSPVDSHAEAVQQANDTRYGLTGSVWTRNRALGIELARQLNVGVASINDHALSSSVPNLPWGGVNDSGYGRTRGRDGLLEMTRTLSLSVERFGLLPREFFWYPYTSFKYNLLRRAQTLLYAPTWRERLRALLP